MKNLLIEKKEEMLLSIKSKINNKWINVEYNKTLTNKEKSSLLESMFFGLCPTIFGIEKLTGGVIITKGNSLIEAYTSFINDDFRLTELYNLKEFEGKLFSELSYNKQISLGRSKIDLRYLNSKHANDQEAIDLFNHLIKTSKHLI